MKRLLLLLLLCCGNLWFAAGPVAAQPARDALDLAALDGLFTEEARVEVNLRGALLRLVAEASRDDEPELAAMIDGLRGVFVRQYALSSARSGTDGRVRELARGLEGRGWETLVRVREDDEDVYVYTLTSGDFFDGIVVMSMDEAEDEATFVTINGRVDPAQIGRLGARFGVDELEDATSNREN